MTVATSKSSNRAFRGLECFCIAMAIVLGSVSLSQASGLGEAIDSAIQRSVKLYGLGAGKLEGYGTGLLVSAEGHVLTVSSLLIDAKKVRAVTADGKKYEARVVHRDSILQLALLKLVGRSAHGEGHAVSADGAFPFFDLAGEPLIEPGDWVVSAGNSFKIADGAEPVSINHGVFAIRIKLDARRGVRDFPYHGDVLVIDAITSNPGAAGSGVVNIDGQLIGMIGRSVTSNLTHTHLNYAMPLDVLREFVSRAGETSQSESMHVSPSPGVQRVSWDPGIRVVRTGYQKLLPFVDRVTSGSPADLAGIRKDDLILSVNGKAVPDVDSYDKSLKRASVTGSMDVIIRRGRSIKHLHLEQ